MTKPEGERYCFDNLPEDALDGDETFDVKREYPTGIQFADGVWLEITDVYAAWWYVEEEDDG